MEISRQEKICYEFRMLRLRNENQKLRAELESYKTNGLPGGPIAQQVVPNVGGYLIPPL